MLEEEVYKSLPHRHKLPPLVVEMLYYFLLLLLNLMYLMVEARRVKSAYWSVVLLRWQWCRNIQL